MTIYEPRTELGKAIAGALMWDDSVRLEIHDILEEWEPRIDEMTGRAEKLDFLLNLYNFETQGEVKIANLCKVMVDEHSTLGAVRGAFSVLKSCIEAGDKIGTESAIEVIDEFLEAGL